MKEIFTRDAAARLVPILLVGLAFSSMGSTYCSFSSSSSSHYSDCHFHGSTRHCGHHSSVSHQTGVVFLVTDRPNEELRSLFVTITEMTLLGGEVGPQVVYSSREGLRVDLLSLRGTPDSRLYEVVGGETPVPSGVYNAVSLHFTDPTIVLTSGEVIDSKRIDLIAGGKIEVGLEPTVLEPEDLTYVTIDFDASRSVSFSEKDGRWTIRPLIIARALEDSAMEKLRAPTDASGVISEVSTDHSSFTLELTHDRGPVEVGLRPGLVVLDADLRRVAPETIAVGSPATVRGFWNQVGQLDARTITIGKTVSLHGVVKSARPAGPVGGMALAVDLFPGQALEGEVTVLAGDTTLVSVDRVAPIDLADLKGGVSVVVTGGLSGMETVQHEAGSATMSASTIDLKRELRTVDHVDGGTERITGILAASDPEGRTVLISTEDAWRRVTLSRDATIVGLREGPEYLSEDPLLFEDLYKGLHIEVEVNARNATSGFVIVTHPKLEPRGAKF